MAIPLGKAIAEIYNHYPEAIEEMGQFLVKNRMNFRLLGDNEFETVVSAAKFEGYKECVQDFLDWFRSKKV